MPVTTSRWAEFLQDLARHRRWIRSFCAPAAALLVLCDIEMQLMSLVEIPHATCSTLTYGLSKLKALKFLDYDQLKTRAQVDHFNDWREVIFAAERITKGGLEVTQRWERRCRQLKDTSPVALACWHPFEGPLAGEDHVCIAGLRQLGRASPSSFWHFMRGFFIEVFRSLLKRWTPWQIRFLRLQFGDMLYPCDHRFNFMDFFGSFLDHPTTVDPGCELSRRWQLPVLTLGPVADVGSEGSAKGIAACRKKYLYIFKTSHQLGIHATSRTAGLH
eukprot:symbB.v1.2.006812.t1/scaffold409.1/size210228/15